MQGACWKNLLLAGHACYNLTMVSSENPDVSRSKGGKARANKLSAERRSEIAKKASAARWLPQALAEAPLSFDNGLEIQCAVLEVDGQPVRLLSQNGFLLALGIRKGGKLSEQAREGVNSGARLPLFVAHKELKPFIDNDLISVLENPIRYRTLRGSGVVHGIRAEMIPRVCEIWLNARDAHALTEFQKRIAAKADILIRGLARVGIIALVDEATGYQYIREKRSLAKILEDFISKELAIWVKTFPDDYYKELFRLKGWPVENALDRRPAVVGRYTLDLVYDRLGPGIKEELLKITPKDDKGRLKHHLHRRLTENHGYIKLREHLAVVIALMKTSEDWADLKWKIDIVKEKHGETPILPFSER
jgi:P63C domain-containing protein